MSISRKALMKSNSHSKNIYYAMFQILHFIFRIALLLLYEKDLLKAEGELRGYLKMKQRHLEILGYRVIWIRKSVWNSMFMSEPDAKTLYVKSLIWPKQY